MNRLALSICLLSCAALIYGVSTSDTAPLAASSPGSTPDSCPCGDACECDPCLCNEPAKAQRAALLDPPYPVGSVITDSTKPGKTFKIRSWYHDGTEWKAVCDEVRQVTPQNTASMNYDGQSGWTYPGSIDSHLMSDHGVSPGQLATMDKRAMERLHDSLHNSASVPSVRHSQPVVQSRPVFRSSPVFSNDGCPGGVCPTPRRTVWGR